MSESTPSPSPDSAPIADIASLAAHEGQRITLRGWLYNLRSSGKLLFPTFRDGTGTIQGIVPKTAVGEEIFDRIKSLTQESSVVVTGRVRADSRAPSGFELDVDDLHILQRIPESAPYPITPKEHGVDFLMEHRHLWFRSPRQAAILRIRAAIMRAAQEFFDTRGFIRTDPPILTPAACEGTSTLFELDYFGDPAYLTQSGQLYIESTAMALGKVYSFGPTFRAEKSKTRRHLTEFWMIEPEVAWLELDGLMDLAEAFITHIVTRVLEQHRADLTTIGRDISKLEAVIAPTSNADQTMGAATTEPTPTNLSSRPERSTAVDRAAEGPAVPTNDAGAVANPGAPFMERSDMGGSSSEARPSLFPRLSYDEAHAMLDAAYKEGKLEHPHLYGDDFGSPDETYISSQFDRPVLIHRYPAAIKAFYMQPDPADPTKALCVDVLAPEGYGEIIGGSQRADSLELLESRIAEHGLPKSAFEWYLDLRRYGTVPHAGFGMGIERAVAWICSLDHVRETIPFPRTLNRIYP